ncbi:MAG: hypothetical protein ACYC69_02670 [Thermodesulfovibrionales bacterium]
MVKDESWTGKALSLPFQNLKTGVITACIVLSVLTWFWVLYLHLYTMPQMAKKAAWKNAAIPGTAPAQQVQPPPPGGEPPKQAVPEQFKNY